MAGAELDPFAPPGQPGPSLAFLSISAAGSLSAPPRPATTNPGSMSPAGTRANVFPFFIGYASEGFLDAEFSGYFVCDGRYGLPEQQI
jgi:hypothetical protein